MIMGVLQLETIPSRIFGDSVMLCAVLEDNLLDASGLRGVACLPCISRIGYVGYNSYASQRLLAYIIWCLIFFLLCRI